MKKKILLLMGIFSIGIMHAQVGINTNNPQGVFHIDPMGDTLADGSNISDDIIVDGSGNLSIGAGKSPSAKVHIMSALPEKGFRLEDGSEAKGRILTTSNTGNITWKSIAKTLKLVKWKMSNPAFYYNGSSQLFSADVAANVKVEALGMTTTNTLNSLTIPPGRYLLFWRGLVHNDTYIHAGLRTASGTYAMGYIEHFSNASIEIVNISTTTTFQFFVTLADGRKQMRTAYYPPITLPGWFEIVFLNLD